MKIRAFTPTGNIEIGYVGAGGLKGNAQYRLETVLSVSGKVPPAGIHAWASKFLHAMAVEHQSIRFVDIGGTRSAAWDRRRYWSTHPGDTKRTELDTASALVHSSGTWWVIATNDPRHGNLAQGQAADIDAAILAAEAAIASLGLTGGYAIGPDGLSYEVEAGTLS